MSATDIAGLLGPERIIPALRVADKAGLLRELASRAAAALAIEPGPLLDALSARERLGSTGVGQGVALPHARIDGLRATFGLFARLERAIDFAAIDAQPVDLVFLLLFPPDAGAAHLPALAAVARRLRDKAVARELRATKDVGRLYRELTEPKDEGA